MRIITLSILSFVSVFIRTSEKQCIIRTEDGVNNIVAGKSTLDDVIKEFGPNKIRKKWIKPIEVEIFGHHDYFLIYKNLGMTFSTYQSRRKKIVEIIKLDSTC